MKRRRTLLDNLTAHATAAATERKIKCDSMRAETVPKMSEVFFRIVFLSARTFVEIAPRLKIEQMSFYFRWRNWSKKKFLLHEKNKKHFMFVLFLASKKVSREQTTWRPSLIISLFCYLLHYQKKLIWGLTRISLCLFGFNL